MKKLIALVFAISVFATVSCASCIAEGTCDAFDEACASAANETITLNETSCAACNVVAATGCTIEWK